ACGRWCSRSAGISRPLTVLLVTAVPDGMVARIEVRKSHLAVWLMHPGQEGADETTAPPAPIEENSALLILWLPRTQIRAYRWCSPPRIGCAIMSPNRSIGRVQDASLPSERCVRTSL